MLALKSTGWCVLGCWLSYLFKKGAIFATTASWQDNEQQVLRMNSIACWPHSAVMEGRRAAGLAWGIHRLDFRLQNALDRKVRGVYIQRKWQPTHRSPRFHQELLDSPCGVDWWYSAWSHLFCRIRLLDSGDHKLSQKLLVNITVNPFARRSQCSINLQCPHSACITSFCPFAVGSGPRCHSVAFSDLKTLFCYCWGPRTSLYVAVLHRALSNGSAASDMYGDRRGPPPSNTPMTPLLEPLPISF